MVTQISPFLIRDAVVVLISWVDFVRVNWEMNPRKEIEERTMMSV